MGTVVLRQTYGVTGEPPLVLHDAFLERGHAHGPHAPYYVPQLVRCCSTHLPALRRLARLERAPVGARFLLDQGPLLSPKPKSMTSWQHGLPAGTAANSEAPWSKGVQGEEGFRRDSCLQTPSPWPAGSSQSAQMTFLACFFLPALIAIVAVFSLLDGIACASNGSASGI